MRWMRLLLWSVVVVCVCQKQVEAQGHGVAIEYTAGQTADVYEPAGVGPFPAIVYLHGGSWRSGSQRDFRKLATDLAAQGYVGFSIGYDLHAGSWPRSLTQARAAVQYLGDHAAEFRVDPRRIIVAGTSAGGELAALVALGPQDESFPVAGAMILNGVYELRLNAHVIKRYLGGSCAQIAAVCAAASPIAQIHPGAPPFFLGHGTADSTVPFAAATAFAEALRASKIPVTFFTAQRGPHSYWEKKEFYAANRDAMEAFLMRLVGTRER